MGKLITYNEYQAALRTVEDYIHQKESELKRVKVASAKIIGSNKITRDSYIDECFDVRILNGLRSYTSLRVLGDKITALSTIRRDDLLMIPGLGDKSIDSIDRVCIMLDIKMKK